MRQRLWMTEPGVMEKVLQPSRWLERGWCACSAAGHTPNVTGSDCLVDLSLDQVGQTK
jgi:hypothetical protein